MQPPARRWLLLVVLVGAALRFVPKEKLEEKGLGEYKKLFEKK